MSTINERYYPDPTPGEVYPPIDGVDTRYTKHFLDTGMISPEILDTLSPEAIEQLRREKYVPAEGGLADLPLLKHFARTWGRTSVMLPQAYQETYRTYGDNQTLYERFLQEHGYVDETQGQAITLALQDVTGEDTSWEEYLRLFEENQERGIFIADTHGARISVLGEFATVVDSKPDGKPTAYQWPYLGVRTGTMTHEEHKTIRTQLRNKLHVLGVKPWRVGTFAIDPEAYGSFPGDLTTGIFIGANLADK